MAFVVISDAFVSINGVNLSDHVKQVEIKYSAETQEKTAMGDTFKRRTTGLKDWSIDVEFYQDYDAGKIDDTLFSLVGAESFPVIVRHKSDPVGSTNPQYSGNAVLPEYTPISGEVGQLSMAKVTFEGDGTLTRTTA